MTGVVITGVWKGVQVLGEAKRCLGRFMGDGRGTRIDIFVFLFVFFVPFLDFLSLPLYIIDTGSFILINTYIFFSFFFLARKGNTPRTKLRKNTKIKK